jgi:hypothetical protein
VGRLGFLLAAMAVQRPASWDAGGWWGSSRGASTDWCGAVGAFSGGEMALYRRVDRRPSGGGAGSSPALSGMMVGRGEMKLEGLGSTSESLWCSSSAGLGFRGNEDVDDGGQWWRRGSGEGSSSGKRKCCGLGVLG